MITRTMMIGMPLLALCACAQQNAADVVNKGNVFFGRDATYVGMQEVPRYSDSFRAEQDDQIASKYQSDTHQYGLAAAVPAVEVAAEDLPPPMPVSVSELPESEPQMAMLSATPAAASYSALEPVAMDLQPDALAPLVAMDEVNEENVAAKVVADKAPPALDSINTRSSNFIWPAEGKIISGFGVKRNGLVNDGINIEASEGEPIWSAAKGEVVYAGNELKGYGNMVIIRHENNWMTAYAHASDMIVKKGDKVGQGDLIGYVGATGNVSEPQLHFGIREGKKAVNPEELLPRRFASSH